MSPTLVAATFAWFFFGQRPNAPHPLDRFGPYSSQGECAAGEQTFLAQDPHNEIAKDCETAPTGASLNYFPDTAPHYPEDPVPNSP